MTSNDPKEAEANNNEGDFKDWPPLTEEEKTRHESLFFCQGPIEGLLPGEQVCQLFLKSGLSLQVLSQIWNLVDLKHDNMLDIGEFCVAMHLIQGKLGGKKLPSLLPPWLTPAPRAEVRPPAMTRAQLLAYRRFFYFLMGEKTGGVSGGMGREIFRTSSLPSQHLARVWNLADLDRDGTLSCDEFAIACHLLQHLKKGNLIDGPVNVKLLFPNSLPKNDIVALKHRLWELSRRKPKLMQLRERRKLEAAREERRATLHRERLKLLANWFQIINSRTESDNGGAQLMLEKLQKEQTRVEAMAAVAERLKEDHKWVREETAGVIMEEQKFSQELQKLEQEADDLKKQQEKNTVIKDLDPFHQLYEQRKEEKQTGQRLPSKDYEIHIPQQFDPFDADNLQVAPQSGENIFLESTLNEEDIWAGAKLNNLDALTCKFDDDFVTIWNRMDLEDNAKSNSNLSKGLSRTESGGSLDSLFEGFDPVFKTVAVPQEEDDLWCHLPAEELEEVNETVQRLVNKLTLTNEQVDALRHEGPQLIFREDGDDSVDPNLCSVVSSERHLVSPPTLEVIQEKVTGQGQSRDLGISEVKYSTSEASSPRSTRSTTCTSEAKDPDSSSTDGYNTDSLKRNDSSPNQKLPKKDSICDEITADSIKNSFSKESHSVKSKRGNSAQRPGLTRAANVFSDDELEGQPVAPPRRKSSRSKGSLDSTPVSSPYATPSGSPTKGHRTPVTSPITSPSRTPVSSPTRRSTKRSPAPPPPSGVSPRRPVSLPPESLLPSATSPSPVAPPRRKHSRQQSFESQEKQLEENSEMDAESRRDELERLRARFFGKGSGDRRPAPPPPGSPPQASTVVPITANDNQPEAGIHISSVRIGDDPEPEIRSEIRPSKVEPIHVHTDFASDFKMASQANREAFSSSLSSPIASVPLSSPSISSSKNLRDTMRSQEPGSPEKSSPRKAIAPRAPRPSRLNTGANSGGSHDSVSSPETLSPQEPLSPRSQIKPRAPRSKQKLNSKPPDGNSPYSSPGLMSPTDSLSPTGPLSPTRPLSPEAGSQKDVLSATRMNRSIVDLDRRIEKLVMNKSLHRGPASPTSPQPREGEPSDEPRLNSHSAIIDTSTGLPVHPKAKSTPLPTQSSATAPSRVVLDLDSHQFVPNIHSHNVDSQPKMTAEEEYIVSRRDTAGSYVTHLKSNVTSGSDSEMFSIDGSISNYDETDMAGMPRSELEGLTDDSDLSDTEGAFRATFWPRRSDDADDEDSGINMSSHGVKSPDWRDEDTPSSSRRGSDSDRSPRSTTEVNLKMTRSYSPEIKPLAREGLVQVSQVRKLEAHNSTHSINAFATQPGQGVHANTHHIATEKPQSDNRDSAASGSRAHLPDASGQMEPNTGPMDPVTGLRKTGLITPMDKAFKFMESPEKKFKVKKKAETDEDKEAERQTLIDSMKIRRPKMDSWMSDNPVPVIPTGSKTESEIKYEERKKTYPSPAPKPVDVVEVPPKVIKPVKPDDVDLRSISDQLKTKEHWEAQIATGEVSIFPKQPEVPKSKTLNDLTDFKSEVETESIADLAKTKQRWERLSVSDENILQSSSPKVKLISNSPRSVGLPNYSNGPHSVSKSTTESSYQSFKTSLPTTNGTDEDVFLSANSYDEKTVKSSGTAKKDETQEKDTMPITKVPPPSKANFRPTPNVRVPPSATAPIVNASSQNSRPEFRQSESIIDREIREQQEREQEIRIRLANSSDKELQQSELERREKEQERLAAHESIIDREIRLQREREEELQKEKQRKLALGNQRGGIQDTEQSQVKPLLSPPVKESAGQMSVSPAFPNAQSSSATFSSIQSSNAAFPNVQSSSMQETTTNIGYEEAISTFAHQGESIIAKELREQKEREMELRKRWKEMGMESPLDNSVPDTPYNRPDPPQPRHTLPRQNKNKKEAPTSYSDLPNMKNVGQRSVSQKTSETPRAHVSPLMSDMDESDQTDASSETPIEREIRLSQERESELRRLKGIITEKVAETVRLEYSPESENSFRKPFTSDTERGTIKRLAANRLHHEIQMEQQRENEMKRQTNVADSSKVRSGSVTNGKSPQVASQATSQATSQAAPQASMQTSSISSLRYQGDVVRGEDLAKSRKMEAEARIQQELREMRDREEELRKLHGGAPSSSSSQDNGHLNNNYEMTTNGNMPMSKSMSSLSLGGGDKASRRKSTLAEEWERRVANGNYNDIDS